MSSMYSFMKLIGSSLVRKPNTFIKSKTRELITRSFADTSKADSTSKQVVVQGSEGEARVRVRRARPMDVPRVLRFVREHAPLAWPGLFPPTANQNVLLADYVTRTLAQGHSLVAEQQEARRGWGVVRGLALVAALCPWDALLLEKWARCVRCARFRHLMLFTAHCLRAPALHHKYRVHSILQVVVLVPPESPRAAEIIAMLAKSSIQRGRDVGYPVIRFDVTNDLVGNVLGELQLRKEWEFNYEVLPNSINIFSSNAWGETKSEVKKESNTEIRVEGQGGGQSLVHSDSKKGEGKGRFITVYTAFPHSET